MNSKKSKIIGLSVSNQLKFGATEIKESIKEIINLFKESVEIDAFMKKLSEKKMNAIELLEKVI